jgi:protein disulfide-isomerase
MKRWLVALGLMVTAWQGASAAEWLTDLPTALRKAKAENKAVLLDFTGSDWCGWCQKLKGEVFDQPSFATYADANLVLVEVDFPKRTLLSSAQVADNEKLAQKYGIHGFPTIIMLNADGRTLGVTGYVPGGPPAFIGKLVKMPGVPQRGGVPVAAPAPPAPEPEPEPAKPAAPFVLAFPNSKTAQYGDLTLKSISGVGDRRMVLINNQTLMRGETGSVKTHETSVSVTVKEIRDKSVVIVVKGQTNELALAGGN